MDIIHGLVLYPWHTRCTTMVHYTTIVTNESLVRKTTLYLSVEEGKWSFASKCFRSGKWLQGGPAWCHFPCKNLTVLPLGSNQWAVNIWYVWTFKFQWLKHRIWVQLDLSLSFEVPLGIFVTTTALRRLSSHITNIPRGTSEETENKIWGKRLEI